MVAGPGTKGLIFSPGWWLDPGSSRVRVSQILVVELELDLVYILVVEIFRVLFVKIVFVSQNI